MIAHLQSQPLFQWTSNYSTTEDKESQVLSNANKMNKYFTHLLLSEEQEDKETIPQESSWRSCYLTFCSREYKIVYLEQLKAAEGFRLLMVLEGVVQTGLTLFNWAEQHGIGSLWRRLFPL